MNLFRCCAPLFLLVAAHAAPNPAVHIGRLPLSFEPVPGNKQFLARTAGLRVAVRSNGASLHLSRGGRTADVHLTFAGAAPNMDGRTTDALPGKANYFIGRNPRNWRTNVPTFGKVEFAQVYRGIDVVYYGNGGQFEYDFRVGPGADPSAIRLVFDGSPLAFSNNGELMVDGLRQHVPVAFQDGPAGRTLVSCRYVKQNSHEARLELGAYDRSRTLIIDPVLSYSTFLGGSLNDGVTSLKVDSIGNVYIAGFTNSTNFPTRAPVQAASRGTNSQLLQAQFGDAFVAKLNPAGTALLYSTYLGGSGDDFASSIAIDAAGNAYVAGSTQSSDFPVTAGVLQTTYKGFTADDNNGFYNPGDGFVVKLGPAGDRIQYATYLGGRLNDLATGIAVDSNGNAVVVGSTESSDFPTSANAAYPRFRGNAGSGPSVGGDGFVSVLNAGGTALTYSTFLGGSGHDGASGVALDAQNNIYVCGVTFSSDFPTTAGAVQTAFKGVPVTVNGFTTVTGDAFVTKLSSQGALVYSTYLGGSDMDAAAAIAVDSTGSAVVTGATKSRNFPATAGAVQTAYKGSGAVGTIGDSYGGDAFVARLNPAATALVYATYLGGAGDEAGLGIAVDAASNAYVTGFTLSSDFPVTRDALQSTNSGFGGQGLAPNPGQGFNDERVRNTGDAFVTKLSGAGALVYSSFYGGSRDDAGIGIALDPAGNAYIGGGTLSASLPGASTAVQPAFAGAGLQWPRGDGFVARFDFGGQAAPTPASVTIVAGFNGAGSVGAALATPFVVQVADATGAPIPNVPVTFSAVNASVTPASATTDARGQATATVTLANTVGTGSVTATVSGIPAVTSALTINAAGAAGPTIKAFVNGASYDASVSPGSWVAVYIDQTASAQLVASDVPLPKILGGFRVLVNGAPIPVYAVIPQVPSGTQINAQLPYEVAPGAARVVVEQNGAASAPFSFTVLPSAPGIFLFNGTRAVAQNVNPDRTVSVNTADNPVPAGDYILAYFTGQGALNYPVATGDLAGANPLSIPVLSYSATLGGNAIPVAFVGMTPGQIGLAQANIQIPRDTPPGTYPLVIKIGSKESNGPVITVTNPRP